MTGTPSDHDSQPASMRPPSKSGDANNNGSRLLALTGLSITVLSMVLSVLTYGILPEQIRIHWTFGLGPYYGPEFAPTVAVLIGFPVLIAVMALGAYWLDTKLRRVEEFATIRAYYTTVMIGVLGILLASQGVLIAANMW